MLFHDNLINSLKELNLIEYITKLEEIYDKNIIITDFKDNDIIINNLNNLYINNKDDFNKLINNYIIYYNAHLKNNIKLLVKTYNSLTIILNKYNILNKKID